MLIKINLNHFTKQICESYGILVNQKPSEEQMKLRRHIVQLIGQYSDALKTVRKYEDKERCGPLCQSTFRKASAQAREAKRELEKLGVKDLAKKVRLYREAQRPDYLKR